jgi:hypothetical protein
MVLEVRGVMLKDPSSGNPEFFALKIRELKQI